MRLAIAAIMAAIVLFAGLNVASVEPISPQRDTGTPVATAPQPVNEDDCTPEAYPNWTERDYRASGKTSPVSLTPQYNITGWEDFNQVFHAVMCGGMIGSSVRGPNRLVAEGVFMALNDGRMRHFTSDEKWHDAVREVMGGWVSNSTRLNGMRDDPGITKTVYAERDRHGKLVLKVDMIDRPRISSYAFTTFYFRGKYYTLKLNVACMQATSIDYLRSWRYKP